MEDAHAKLIAAQQAMMDHLKRRDEPGLRIMLSRQMELAAENWISVEDRLPEIGGYYLVLCYENEDGWLQDVMMYDDLDGSGEWDWDYWQVEWKPPPFVTHWMPLPDPPDDSPPTKYEKAGI